jgi:hypothetical protein
LIASAMVPTGGVIYAALGSQNTITPGVHNPMELHLFLATFIWAYLYGHELMALCQQHMGPGRLTRISKL